MRSNSLRHSQPLVRTLETSSLLASARFIFSAQGENRAEVSGQIVDDMVHRYVLFGLSPLMLARSECVRLSNVIRPPW